MSVAHRTRGAGEIQCDYSSRQARGREGASREKGAGDPKAGADDGEPVATCCREVARNGHIATAGRERTW